MIRLATALALALTVAVSYGVYRLKHEVRLLEDRLAALDRAIAAENQIIHVLRAEWAFLNRPAALQAAADRHLALQPVAARQIVAIDDLPFRREPGPDRWKVIPVPRPKPTLSSHESQGARR